MIPCSAGAAQSCAPCTPAQLWSFRTLAVLLRKWAAPFPFPISHTYRGARRHAAASDMLCITLYNVMAHRLDASTHSRAPNSKLPLAEGPSRAIDFLFLLVPTRKKKQEKKRISRHPPACRVCRVPAPVRRTVMAGTTQPRGSKHRAPAYSVQYVDLLPPLLLSILAVFQAARPQHTAAFRA